MSDPSIAAVLGTRPEIIKMAPLLDECQKRGLDVYVIHTGQHYSESLDEIFFRQLDLDPPDVNLDVASDDHGAQTAKMLAGIEKELQDTGPSMLFVQGDTNSTLAGALAGAKLDVDVAHIEAGLRSFDREMPEELNRIVVDHLSDFLFAPTQKSADQLRGEGISDSRITVTGNTIVDAVEMYESVAESKSTILSDWGLKPEEFAIMTAHRAETVDDAESFRKVLKGVARAGRLLGVEVVYPIHPRAEKRLTEFNLAVPDNIRTVNPVGFLDFLWLESTAAVVFTDSGGIQEESCILGTPCVTFRYGTERPETAFVGANCIAGQDPLDITAAATKMYQKETDWEPPFGDGNASSHILNALPVPYAKSAVPPSGVSQVHPDK